MSYFRPGFIQDPSNGQQNFTSMDFLIDSLSQMDNSMASNEEETATTTEEIDVELQPEEFRADYEAKLVATNEVCSKVSDILGRIFVDFAGCRESFNNGRIYIELGFDINLGAGAPEGSLRALETLAQANASVDPMVQKMQMLTNSIHNQQSNSGYIDENIAKFRMTDTAIAILKKIAIADYDQNEKNNKNFRTINIAYEYDQYSNKISLIVRGMTIEKAMELIYGNKFKYRATLGSSNRRTGVGYILEVRRIKQSTINELQQRYVGTVVGPDRFIRPHR